MSLRLCVFPSILVGLMVAACSQNAMTTPATVSTSGGAAASSSSPTAARTFERRSLLMRDSSISTFDAFDSAAINILTGEENTTPDFGHLQFMATSGISKDEDGFFVSVRQAQTTAGVLQLGVIDKGTVDPTLILEAPEGGYSSATVGKRNRQPIQPNGVYILRIRTSDDTTYFGRLWIKDIEPTRISYQLVTQSEAGNRRFI